LSESPNGASALSASISQALEGLTLEQETLEKVTSALELALSVYPDLPNYDLPKINLLLDNLMAELDQTISKQINTILHADPLMTLERGWRSLKFLLDHSETNENISIEILDATKSEVYYDLADSPEITRSSLFRKIYTAEYGQFGGHPFAAVVTTYELSAKPEDFALMRLMSNLGVMSHLPFISSVDYSFFGLSSWDELPAVEDLDSIFSQPRYSAWQAIRNQENSRYLVLVLPGFLSRLPYSPKDKSSSSISHYEEAEGSDKFFVWGLPAILLALKLIESFARYRWCVNIVGLEGGGLIEDLPMIEFKSMGRIQNRIPLQALIGEKLEQELSNNGLIAISLIEAGSKAVIYSAPTVLKPKTFGPEAGGAETSFNHRVSTLLPYMMIINRLAHYIKVIQRENIGTWKDPQVLEKELNNWLNQFVTDMDNPTPSIRGKRPLRMAKVEVTSLPDQPGWLQMSLSIRPHLKFMGAAFTLSLIGRLDQVDLSLT
jgi:type VI secretion system protein ImpC